MLTGMRRSGNIVGLGEIGRETTVRRFPFEELPPSALLAGGSLASKTNLAPLP